MRLTPLTRSASICPQWAFSALNAAHSWLCYGLRKGSLAQGALAYAMFDFDVHGVKRALLRGANPNEPIILNGRSSLPAFYLLESHLGLAPTPLEILRLLALHGADLKGLRRVSACLVAESLIQAAARAGSFDLAIELIELGADPWWSESGSSEHSAVAIARGSLGRSKWWSDATAEDFIHAAFARLCDQEKSMINQTIGPIESNGDGRANASRL